MGMVRINGAMTICSGGAQPLLVGVAMRQALSPTGRAHAALTGLPGGTAPTWAAALAGRRG
jgi:hypothetical protein